MDFGCGNGNFIRAFSEKFTSWSLLGVEQNNKYEDIISSIPNTKFSLNIIDQIFDKFDLISLIHVLEHIPHPAKFLNKIKSNLKKDGLILIEIPNLENSPFDILIADHLSHFNKKSLQYCLNSVNLEIVFLSDSVIDKELTIIAKASDNTNPRSDPEIFFESKNLLEINLEFITKLLFSSKREVNNIGIFGSSIAASWLAGQLGEKVQFFIDEDPQKIGNEHLGIPIISISAVPKGSTIILPFRQDVSSNIVHKFNPISNINFVRAI
jgi:SAM-dependent methyltransferase